MDFKNSGIVDGIDTGFMGGRIKGFHKFTRTIDGKVGVIYSDGMGNLKEINPEELTWSGESEFSTKGTIKGITVTKNIMG